LELWTHFAASQSMLIVFAGWQVAFWNESCPSLFFEKLSQQVSVQQQAFLPPTIMSPLLQSLCLL
jgi:hypothetical protein